MEVSIAELERDPAETMQGIYASFGCSDFGDMKPRLAAYTASLAASSRISTCS